MPDLPDLPDLTPPPEEPMPDHTKASIRERLLADAQRADEPTHTRWLVPGLVAAAVLCVVGVGAWAVNLGSESTDRQVQPAGSDSATPTEESQTPGPTDTPPPATDAPPPVTEDTDVPTDQGATRITCNQELRRTTGIRGPEEVARIGHGDATTSFMSDGSRWLVCDDLHASQAGESPVLLPPHRASAPYAPSPENLAFATTSLMDQNFESELVHFLAAGRMFEGVEEIAYTFPDGHTEVAGTTTDANGDSWWAMNYEADSGLFLKPTLNYLKLDPVEVVVTYTDGRTERSDLRWGEHDCAHINIGC